MVENSENTEENAEDVAGGKEEKSAESTEKRPKPQATTKESKMWAMLAHLLGLFTCFIGPLIIWMVKKEEDKFIDDQSKEALNFQITVAIAMVVSGLLAAVCVGVILGMVVGVADLIFCIIACVKANSGEAYRYPISIRFVK